MQRNGFQEEEARSRINSQMSLREKSKLASFVIDNSMDRDHTKRQVYDLYKKIVSSKKHYHLRAGLAAILAGTLSCLFLLARYLS